MNYSDAIKFIESREKFGMNLGLSRVEKLLRKLCDPQKKFRSIHIAGTNGKGSVAAMLSAVLKEAGYKVGLYTSPHFISYTERIRISEKDISEKDLAAAVSKVKSVFRKNRKLIGEPTVFEILTAAAFVHFASKKVEIAVLEVGLGGRLDATNVVAPLVSVITNVDLDHTNVLGNSIEKIAYEKAGIIKKHVPVVTAAEGPALKVIRNTSAALKAPATVLKRKGTGFISPLAGDHQKINLSVAIEVINILKRSGFNISAKDIKQGLLETRWRGRFEVISKRPTIVLDGAHNPAGARALRNAVLSGGLKRPITMILGILKDKNIGEIVKNLAPIADRIISTSPSHPRAASSSVVARAASKYSGNVLRASSVYEALKRGADYGDDQTIIVTGSLFTVSDAIKIID